MEVAGEGDGGENRESRNDMYTPPCVIQTASRSLLQSTGSPAQRSVLTHTGRTRGRKMGEGRPDRELSPSSGPEGGGYEWGW